jgi:ABC-2 type transport system ATP-binding protein
MVAEGITTIVSTSYLDEAERCDRLVLLHEGRALALDAPARLQQRLDGRLVVVRASDPRSARDRLRAHPAVRRASLFGEQLHVVLAAGTDAAALRRVEGVSDVVAGEPSLEDVFIELVASEALASA